jgi:hypothetical protein
MLQSLAYALSRVMPSAVATSLFDSLCTIQQPSDTLGEGGAPSGTYTNVTGLANIPCMDSVPREGTIEATEMRDIREIQAAGYRHILLSGYYWPQIWPLIKRGLRAIVVDRDGTTITYNVFGAEPDSQNTSTRLHLTVISV